MRRKLEIEKEISDAIKPLKTIVRNPISTIASKTIHHRFASSLYERLARSTGSPFFKEVAEKIKRESDI